MSTKYKSTLHDWDNYLHGAAPSLRSWHSLSWSSNACLL